MNTFEITGINKVLQIRN